MKKYHVFVWDGNINMILDIIDDMKESNIKIIRAWDGDGVLGSAVLGEGETETLLKFLGESTYYGDFEDESQLSGSAEDAINLSGILTENFWVELDLTKEKL